MRAQIAIAVSALVLVLVLGYQLPSVPTRPPPTGAEAAMTPRPECVADSDEQTQFSGPPRGWSLGEVSVQVTLSGCELVEVAAELETTNPLSERRSTGALERLRSAVLSSQCADVDAVSGATGTSEAYLGSLQAALDAANAGAPC